MALVSSVEAPSGISSAIKRASKATGTDFRYLLTTAARESAFKTNARAKTSSAAGLFQFIENTWLKTVKEEGSRFGLGKYSSQIHRTGNGRYYVPDREIRAEILKLRHDANVSAMMAGAFTQQNAEFVESKLGRGATQGELYIAHFLGPAGATKMIAAAEDHPGARADRLFPKAAGANRGIFYSGGRPRSVKQVYDLLVSDHSRLEALTVASADPARTGAAKAPGPATDEFAGMPLSARDIRPASDVKAEIKQPLPPVVITKVAALDTGAIPVAQATMSDAGMGSIGPWQTIVHRAGDTAAKPMLMAPPRRGAGESASAKKSGEPIVVPEASQARTNPRPAESAGITHDNATTPRRPARTASPINLVSAAYDLLQSEHWTRMSYGGS